LSTSTPPDGPDWTPVRLLLARGHEERELDGAWWPRSRDLEAELGALVQHFPTHRGRIVRALVSPPDWDPHPRRIGVAEDHVKVGASSPDDDTHVVDLSLTDRSLVRLLVVPPETPEVAAEGAMFASTQPGNTTVGAAVLLQASSPYEQWNDQDDSWWEPHPVPPSYRAPR
jgi:hypothetical protein